MPGGRPQFELRVAARADLQQRVFAAVVQLDARQALRVAAIEAFGQPQDRGERPDGLPALPRQTSVLLVTVLRRRAPMVPRDQRDRVDFLRLEAAQVAVLDQVVRVLVMPLVADMAADVVEQRGVLQPLALAIGQSMHGARLLENRQGEPRDLGRVLGPVVAPLPQFHDAAAADIGIAIGLRNFLAMPRDVVEHQPFPQRHVAQCDVLGAQAPDNRVDQHRTRDR